MCPGHFGHIELPVVVYNPLVFRCVTMAADTADGLSSTLHAVCPAEVFQKDQSVALHGH